MGKLIKNLIVCLTLIICQSAFCYTLSGSELNKTVYNKINSETKKQLGDIEYKINIHGTFSDVITNDLSSPNVELSKLNNFAPVSYRRVTVKDSKGNIVKTFPLNIQIQIYKEVLVALENIPYGKSVDNSNTKLERKEISKIYDNILTYLPDDSISSKNIVKGSAIQKNALKKKAIIVKNQNVDIEFIGNGIQITLRGKALNEGAMGDLINVRSEKYNKIYSARVDSNSKVTVRI